MARERVAHLAPLARETPGDGASSMSFWWRRWTEHSRSPRWIDVAVLVGHDLQLDVARPLDVALEVHRAVAERGQRLGCAVSNSCADLAGRGTIFMPRPPPPAAALRMTGKPILSAIRSGLVGVVELAACPGRSGRPAFSAGLARRDLVPHEPDHLRPRADEREVQPLTTSANSAFSERKP